MPVVDIKFKERVVAGHQLCGIAEDVARVVACHLDSLPEHVSVEIIPQTPWILNRKDIDIEVRLHLSSRSNQRPAIAELARALVNLAERYLAEQDITCSLSATIQVFQEGVYEHSVKNENGS
ncbi:MAG: hypothetical protein HZB31_11300 [Nitrospirae bacterium]|nr:hypothetical protein [Nitrospirota bacterium]